MKVLVLIKLGGSLITDKNKPFTPRIDTIKRVAKEIHEARGEKNFDLIVGHGGGSFPHVSASKYKTQKGIVNKESYKGIAVVQNDAARLNRIVVDELLKAGEKAISIQPSACCIAENSKIVEWNLTPIKKMLEYGLLPVPYGDVGLDTRQGCCILSTEEVLGYLGKNLQAKIFISAGIVDGVFTRDPQKDSNAKFIPEIKQDNFEKIKYMLGGSAGIDVTGGMFHKVEELVELTKFGIESVIVNADRPNILKRALLGEKLGTLIRI